MKKWLMVMMLVSGTAYAGDLTVQGGWDHSSNSNYGDSAVINGRLETPVTPILNLGGELSYHGPQSHNTVGDVSGYSVLGEAVYYPPVSWKLKPYVIGGLGWSWWDFDREQNIIDSGITIKLGDSFCQKVGLGADYPLNANWSLNVEWSYFHTNIPKDSKEADGSPSAALGTDDRHGGITIGQEEMCLTGGLKYRF